MEPEDCQDPQLGSFGSAPRASALSKGPSGHFAMASAWLCPPGSTPAALPASAWQWVRPRGHLPACLPRVGRMASPKRCVQLLYNRGWRVRPGRPQPGKHLPECPGSRPLGAGHPDCVPDPTLASWPARPRTGAQARPHRV